MTFPHHIFKAYDIRGLVETELAPELFYRIGRAVIVHTGARHVYVGFDMRPSSVPLSNALISGLLDQGANVTNIGMVSTPMINIMTIRDESADLGVMVTASHNPQEYNGLKFVNKRTMMPIGLENGLDRIRDLVEKYNFVDMEKGSLQKKDVMDEYLDFTYSLADIQSIRPLKIVVDMANGIEGVVIDKLLARLALHAEYLFKEPDGRFPNHEANPLKHETLKDLQKKVVEIGADMGFAYDGDGDRIGLVDETGAIIPGDFILALLVPSQLEMYPGSPVCFDLRSSLATVETIVEHGGRPIECRVGRTLIIENMRKENAAVGGELSCHFYYKDLYGFESGDLTLLNLLAILSKSGKKLSELVAPLRRYFHSGEINMEVNDKKAAILAVEKAFSPGAGTVSHLDGIKINHADWWVNVRASNTESLLRIALEAKSEVILREKIEEVKRVIEKN